jgi:peptidoglycan/LPS O-acetylase OafA/YrhL
LPKNLFHIALPENRNFGLDLLRAFAILFVVFDHGKIFISSIIPSSILSFFIYDGVSIFFVLSGYLIGKILIKNLSKQQNIKTLLNFWIRRWFRTLPNYFFILGIITIWYSLFYGLNPFYIKKYLFFIQNLFYPHPDFFPEAWSLAVEEWFYLISPVIIILIYKLSQKITIKESILIYSFLLIVIISLFRTYKSYHMPPTNWLEWDLNFRKQVITRFDSIIYGVLGAVTVTYHKYLWVRHSKKLFFVGLSLIVLHKYSFTFYNTYQISWDLYTNSISFIIMNLGTLFIIPFIEQLKKPNKVI